MTLDGCGVPLCDVAQIPLEAAGQLGLIVPIIGLVLLGFAIAFGFRLNAVADTIIAGALLVLGATAATSVMGAELPLGMLR